MDKGQIMEIVVMAVCCFGCGAIFLGIGIWASRSPKPIHFWAGTELDRRQVTDVAAYNRENSIMWIVYSIPYFLAGVLSIFDFVSHGFAIASLILIGLACFPGLLILIWRYKHIEGKYRLDLDKIHNNLQENS